MKIKYLFYIASLILAATSCTSDFEETNTNPNNPDSAPLTNLFANAIVNIASQSGKTEMDYPAAFVGQVTKGTYTDPINYLTKPSGSVWETGYGTILTNLNFVIEGANEANNVNLQAAALVLKVYSQQMMVDIYGKVPYFEAGKAKEGIIHAPYDNEKEIYYDLLSSLEYANSLFTTVEGGLLGEGDLIYSGDVKKWKKLCNSLRLRLAIRISNVDATKAKSEIATILGDPTQYPVIENNTDNAFLTYPGGDWVEPWSSEHSSIGDDVMAKPLIDTLNNYNDPRIGYYAEPLADGSYKGLEVGQDADTDYSKVNDTFVNNPTGKIYFLKYAEVAFIKSEAYARAFISGNAQTEYENAITASCKEYGITDQAITSYLSESAVTWKNNLKQIYTQKWIALFRQTWEAWAEMRRTDVPTLSPAAHPASTGHNRAPFRFPYPDSEKKLNSSNIPSSVVEKDYFWGYQIWWDTRTGVQ